MNLPERAKEFLRELEKRMGPVDRPIEFRVFPFDAGGSLNFLTIGRGEPFTIRVSWDLFGHDQQKRAAFGRYELMTVCDNESWSIDTLTMVGRYGLEKLIEPGDTIDLGHFVDSESLIQGVIRETAYSFEI